MKQLILALFGILGLVGCVSPQIVSTSTNTEKSIITVKYLPVPGLSGVTEGRRNDAIAEAKKYCGGGKVKINSETETPETKGAALVGPMALGVSQKFMYLQFECLENIVAAEIH